ncbi:MAG TPA: hypothetical protein VG844_19445 [Terracidiphilus sp.]|nr:hypothetical protein [Terracidiphilus sp.]
MIQQQAPKEKEPRWKAVATRSLAALSVLGLVLALLPLYPTLSINEDYSFDKVFPYNTSFSVTNEGFWPIADISVTCGADFTMRPWTNDPANKSSMKLHTQDSEYKDVAKLLTYKHRLTLPCNHNAVANGHQIDPGASLHILVKYRLAGTDFKQSKDFELKTVAGWGGQSFWQYK